MEVSIERQNQMFGKRRVKKGSLYQRVRHILRQPRLDGGHGTRLDAAAEAYVRMMEQGSFIHLNAFIERQEGKVPTRIADADGNSIKLYAGVPIDGEQAP